MPIFLKRSFVFFSVEPMWTEVFQDQNGGQPSDPTENAVGTDFVSPSVFLFLSRQKRFTSSLF